ncbi:MAG: Lin0512 family protein [Pseudomonadota bacterium]
MAVKRMVLELGMGTSLTQENWTDAACRAVRDAIWHNSVTVADAFGVGRDDMLIEAVIGAGDPAAVDTQAVAAVFPYGKVSVRVEQGGMSIPKDSGGHTIMANAAIIVSLDLPEDA